MRSSLIDRRDNEEIKIYGKVEKQFSMKRIKKLEKIFSLKKNYLKSIDFYLISYSQ